MTISPRFRAKFINSADGVLDEIEAETTEALAKIMSDRLNPTRISIESWAVLPGDTIKIIDNQEEA